MNWKKIKLNFLWFIMSIGIRTSGISGAAHKLYYELAAETEARYRRKYGFKILERCQYHLFKAFRDREIDVYDVFSRFNLETQAKEMTDEILELFKYGF